MSGSPKYSGQGSPSTATVKYFCYFRTNSSKIEYSEQLLIYSQLKYFSDFRINSSKFDYFGIYLFIEKILVFLSFSYKF